MPQDSVHHQGVVNVDLSSILPVRVNYRILLQKSASQKKLSSRAKLVFVVMTRVIGFGPSRGSGREGVGYVRATRTALRLSTMGSFCGLRSLQRWFQDKR